jgi:hypothetical protein
MPCGKTKLYKNLVKEYGAEKGRKIYYSMVQKGKG